MALSDYALRTVAAIKTALGLTGTQVDTLVEECVNQASEMVEQAWGRHIVSRGALTEYHPRRGGGTFGGPELYVNEWPIVSVTSVHEDPNRDYDADTLLTVTDDYIASAPVGKIIRVSSALPIGWSCAWRAVKVIYVAGYQNTDADITGAAAVPAAILRVFDELVGWMIQQRTKGQVGYQSVSDTFGSRTISGPAYITPGMQAALDAAGAVPVSRAGRTGERDS